MPYAVIEETYNNLTEEQQKIVYDLVISLEKMNHQNFDKKSIGDDFYGALNKYANPSLIDKEKDAWLNSVTEKYKATI